MVNSESINVMYNKFNDIMVVLQNLGPNLGSVETKKKLLASLPIE